MCQPERRDKSKNQRRTLDEIKSPTPWTFHEQHRAGNLLKPSNPKPALDFAFAINAGASVKCPVCCEILKVKELTLLLTFSPYVTFLLSRRRRGPWPWCKVAARSSGPVHPTWVLRLRGSDVGSTWLHCKSHVESTHAIGDEVQGCNADFHDLSCHLILRARPHSRDGRSLSQDTQQIAGHPGLLAVPPLSAVPAHFGAANKGDQGSNDTIFSTCWHLVYSGRQLVKYISREQMLIGNQ